MQEKLPITTPAIISRSEHSISRANISEPALKVLYRLKKSGYQAHLVGGGVRDLLLGREPKDFDVATNATPEQVKACFGNARIIGRRFRLVHVRFGREIIEVATFRSLQFQQGEQSDEGMVLRDNEFGTIEEDALRRDFTVNALYYNISDFSVVDYSGGMADLEAGLLRLLGDPETRYREDPVRMLRAARFAAKLGFNIEASTEEPIPRLGHLLAEVPSARLYEEVLKLFIGGYAVSAFEKLRHYDLFARLFPQTEEALSHEDHEFPLTLVLKGLENTDKRLAQGKPVTPAFLFAVLLWEPLRLIAEELQAEGVPFYQALQEAGGLVIGRQVQRVAIPRRFSTPMREIWTLQARFHNTKGKRPLRLLAHPRFRAAYDFLLLRAEAGEADTELAAWWTRFQEQQGLDPKGGSKPAGSKRRRRRPRKKRSSI
ncbi:polynucleotide adenylyltransferase PcnB [Thiolapillus brandeum]|uniref:Poly(A) polymerase I n=1 Tax=Thiolapillus brandeum TaxID=1076588 RepID=A0A7U6GIE9_9GAMM|nr:polynucleotide adenylyltransferase PcnB [Thiolapillus brandeum]BAO44187.1 poly(A) polymerase [Thiolapillus brandeum]